VDAGALPKGSPVAGLRVVVEEFENPAEVARHDGPKEWFGIEAAQKLTRSLAARGAFSLISTAEERREGDLYVRAELTKIDGGSKAARQ